MLGTAIDGAREELDRPASEQLGHIGHLDVAAQVISTVERLSERFPDDVEHVVSLDTTKPIRAGIREIVITLFQAVALVIFVVFVFLQNARSTLIPTLTVPVSLIGTLAVFPLLGFSINTLSLLGLVLAIALGYVIWGDLPPPLMLAGSSLIVASGLWIARIESRQRGSG